MNEMNQLIPIQRFTCLVMYNILYLQISYNCKYVYVINIYVNLNLSVYINILRINHMTVVSVSLILICTLYQKYS